MKCKFESCQEDTFEDLDYCILHMELPEDEKSPEFARINELKNKEIKLKVENGEGNFKGIELFEIDLSGLEIKENLFFTRSKVKKDAKFINSKIYGDISFDGSKIGGNVYFESSRIYGSTSFYGSHIMGNIWFDNAIISKYLWFEKAKISGEISFNEANIEGSISFQNSNIGENISFYRARIKGNAWFDMAEIKGNAWLEFLQIGGKLNFKNTEFSDPGSQEKCCRKAKKIWENIGDREKADYYFYREMEAKRKQKSYYIQYMEMVVQYPFGYGVYPYRLLITFIVALLSFALIFWIIEGMQNTNSLMQNIKFSFLTMIIPAYGVINAKSGIYGLLTIIEAIIGAFTWPTFIVTFARKYMR